MAASRPYPEQVERWLTLCLPAAPTTMGLVRKLKHTSEREVWECEFEIDGAEAAAILSIFKAGSLESVKQICRLVRPHGNAPWPW